MKLWVKVLIGVAILVGLYLGLAYLFGSSMSGNVISNGASMQKFVSCLKNKDVVLFGFDGNQQVEAQLGLFENYSSGIKYIDCRVNQEECAGVIIHPSWKIEDRIVSSGLSLGTLSQLSGCKL